METTTYNGWTNYATWLINLELCDDLVSNLVSDRQMFRDADELTTYLEEAVDEIVSNYGELDGLALNYARAFISNVNFREIAASNADELIDVDEEEDETDDERLTA